MRNRSSLCSRLFIFVFFCVFKLSFKGIYISVHYNFRNWGHHHKQNDVHTDREEVQAMNKENE